MRPLAVTGAGVLCCIGSDLAELAAALRAGSCGVTGRPAAAADRLRPWLSAELVRWDLTERLGRFAPWAVPAGVRVAGRAPLSVRASVAVTAEAWSRARLADRPVPAQRVSLVVAGNNLNGAEADAAARRHAISPAQLSARYALRFLDSDQVGTVSEVFGVRGEGHTVGGASASGNLAILNAARLIECGAAEVCLVVGALSELSEPERQALFNLGAMAGGRARTEPGRRCRPFDADREGFVPAEGAACLVLESAESAGRRGVPGWGWLVGAAAALDGNSLADPRLAGEVSVMRAALADAGIEPAEVDYVNAHGTGSVLGDEIELAALDETFGACPVPPWVNSTKGLTGHCLSAAGVVEAVSTLIQLRQGFVHPNHNLDRPLASRCRLAGPVAVPARLRAAVSNGFGFGGFNSSLVFRPAGNPP